MANPKRICSCCGKLKSMSCFYSGGVRLLVCSECRRKERLVPKPQPLDWIYDSLEVSGNVFISDKTFKQQPEGFLITWFEENHKKLNKEGYRKYFKFRIFENGYIITLSRKGIKKIK